LREREWIRRQRERERNEFQIQSAPRQHRDGRALQRRFFLPGRDLDRDRALRPRPISNIERWRSAKTAAKRR
jgi:hypothetical protein